MFPYPSRAARTAGLANISVLPIEPPPTPRTIRGDGRVHLPRAVPAARNVTRRRPAPANGPRRVRRVGTGQTPPVCGRQQEGHPAAADHTPRTDLLTTAWPLRPRRLRRWAEMDGPQGAVAAGQRRRPRPGGTAGGSFRWPWPPGRGSHAGYSDLPQVRAPAVPGRVAPYPRFRKFSRAAPGRSPAPNQRGDYPRRHRCYAGCPGRVLPGVLLPPGWTASHNASR